MHQFPLEPNPIFGPHCQAESWGVIKNNYYSYYIIIIMSWLYNYNNYHYYYSWCFLIWDECPNTFVANALQSMKTKRSRRRHSVRHSSRVGIFTSSLYLCLKMMRSKTNKKEQPVNISDHFNLCCTNHRKQVIHKKI